MTNATITANNQIVDPKAAHLGAASAGRVWVVLPTYDEADNLVRIVAEVRATLAGCAPDGFRVLVVDDASPDGTGEIADRLAAAHDDVEVLHRPGKAGLGPAYVAGFGHALAGGASYVIQMDADGSHDPAAIPALLATARSGADVVLGSRYVGGGGVGDWNRARGLLSRYGCAYARRCLDAPVHDLTGGFKCFRAAALAAIEPAQVRARGYAFQIEVTFRALRLGQSVVEVPIRFSERSAGRSKMTAPIALEAASRVLALRCSTLRCGALARFATVGASGYLVNVAVFAFLVHLTGVGCRTAAVGAFLAAVTNNFLWNRRWTFRVHTGRPMLQAARFVAVSGAVLVLTLAAMSALVGSGAMGRLAGEAVATAAMTPLSFAGARLWAFATDRPRNPGLLGAHVVS